MAEVGAVLAVIGDADESGGAAAPTEVATEAEEAAADEASDASEAEVKPAPQHHAEEAAEAQAEAPNQDAPTGAAASSGVEVTLPALGESVTEGTISRWLKEVGDTVEADEPLLEVSTDKVDTEIPSPAAGTLLEVRFKEDDVAEVGAVLAVIGDAAAAAEAAPTARARARGRR